MKTCRQISFPGADHSVGCECDHDRVSGHKLFLLNPLKRFNAVHTRHHVVQKHDVVGVLPHEFDCLRP